MQFFCPPAMRDAYKWQFRGDKSVDDYMREFLRLSRHTADMMGDECRSVDLYVTGLGPTYVEILTEGRTLESIIDEARQLERRPIMHGMIPDPYMSRDGGTVGVRVFFS